MIELVARFILPGVGALLPALDTTAARALLLAIGLQESGFVARRQVNGPARSFWQFEAIGVAEVIRHHASRPHMVNVLERLGYSHLLIWSTEQQAQRVLEIMEHNDLLAGACARLALWRHPDALPDAGDASTGWGQYTAIWRPGRPRLATWAAHYADAWRLAERPNGTTLRA